MIKRKNKNIKLNRIDKLKELKKRNINPYYNKFKPNISISSFRNKYNKYTRENLYKINNLYKITGRIVALRKMGGVTFLNLKNCNNKIQVLIQKNYINNKKYNILKYLDLGDFIGIKGNPIKTKIGQLSLKAIDFIILTKSLQSLPDKWHGFNKIEQRYRQRYLDLITNTRSYKIFQNRFKVIRAIQKFLDTKGFIEVETPVLCNTIGGAEAKPFITYHNTLKEKFKLRIATELHLKRLVVGGYNKVYEIGRLFRNEGVSTKHNPEFTTIEFYQAYTDYKDLMILTENLFYYLVLLLYSDTTFIYKNNKIQFLKPFKKKTISYLVAKNFKMNYIISFKLIKINSVYWALNLAKNVISNKNNLFIICLQEFSDKEALEIIPHIKTYKKILNTYNVSMKIKNTMGNNNFYDLMGILIDKYLIKDIIRLRMLALYIIYYIFEEKIEDTLIQPIFVTGFSTLTSPLAKTNENDKAIIDRFELFCGGMEISNAFSELNDPNEQKKRFLNQQKNHDLKYNALNSIDMDFLNALKIGMPPVSGQGIGIDRLIMILTNSSSIKEVMLFPKMKKKNNNKIRNKNIY